METSQIQQPVVQKLKNLKHISRKTLTGDSLFVKDMDGCFPLYQPKKSESPCPCHFSFSCHMLILTNYGSPKVSGFLKANEKKLLSVTFMYLVLFRGTLRLKILQYNL